MPRIQDDPESRRHHIEALRDQKRWQALCLLVENSERWMERHSDADKAEVSAIIAIVGAALVEEIALRVPNHTMAVDYQVQQTIWTRIRKRIIALRAADAG